MMNTRMKNSVVYLLLFLIPVSGFSRGIYPTQHNLFTKTMSAGMNGDDPITQLTLYGGFLAGGKHNTCYIVKSRLTIKDKFMMDGALYYHFNGDRLYDVNIGWGGIIQFTVGAEFGDRTYFINRDSTLEHIRFRNTATGAYEPYSSFPDFQMPEEITSYNIGISFNGRFKGVNYWRGVGECWRLVSFKWEMMYAPKVGYDETLDIITQDPYQANTTSYDLEGIKVKHFGFRMVMDSRMGSKIGWMMEFGMRPGIKSELNEENHFSNGYVRMGVCFGISLGGRKQLDRPGFGKEIPEN